MKWLRRLALLCLAAGAAAAAAWWALAPRVIESVRRRGEEELSRVFETEVHLKRLTVGLARLRLEVGELEIGRDSGTARVGVAAVRLLPYSSLLQRRPVLDLDADGVFLDVAKLPRKTPERPRGESGMENVPAFRLRRVRIANARVVAPAGAAPFDLSAADVQLRLATRPGGRLTGQARVENLRVGRGGEAVDLREVRLELRRTAEGFRIDRLHVEGDALRADASVEREKPLRHAVRIEGQIGPLAKLDPDLKDLSGNAEIEGTVDGRLEEPEATAHLRARTLAWQAETVDDLQADLGWRANRLEVRSARALGYGGELELSGSLGTAAEFPYDVSGRWKGVDVARAAASGGVELRRALASAGQVSASGTLDPPTVDGTASGSLDDAAGVKVDWKAKGRAARAEQRVELDAAEGSSNAARAAVSLDAERRLDGTIDVALGDTAPLRTLLGAPDLPSIAGTLVASAGLSGTLSRPELSGDVTGRDVAALGVRFTRVDGAFRLDREHLDARAIEIAAGAGTIRGSGTIGLAAGADNQWQVEVRDVALTDVAAVARALGYAVPVKGGSFSATARGSGPWTAAILRVDARAREIDVSGEHVQGVTLTAAATWPRWNAALELVHRPEELLSARLSGQGAGDLSAEIDSTPWSLAGLAAGRDAGVTGEVSIQARLAGPPEALAGQASAQVRNLKWGERTIGDTAIDLDAARGAWNLRSDLLDGALRVEARVVPGADFTLGAELADAHLAPFLSDDPALTVDASGTLHLTGRVDSPRRLGGELDLSRLAIASGTFRAEAAPAVRVRGANGAFAVESFHLQGSGTELDVTGTADTSGAVNLSAHGAGSLQLLEAIGHPIESVRGTFSLHLQLRTAPGVTPDIVGSLELHDAALDAGLPFGPTETTGVIRFDRSLIRVERLEGHLGGGTFAIGGTLDLATGPALTWQVTEVSTGLVPSLEHEISGHGTVEGTWGEPKVAGELEILRALYDRRIEVRDFLPSFRRELAKAPEEEGAAPHRALQLDLHVFAPDELFIDNNFARLEAQADLRLRGTPESPELTGRVQLINGEVYFRGRTFDVRTAVIDFRRELGLNAYLNIVAESEIATPEATYTVTLQITGRTDNVRVAMSADDGSLTQNDIASLIAFGRTAAQLQKEGGGVSVGDILELAPGGGYTEKVQRGTAKLLRVDRFEIEPAFSRTSGEFEPQLSVGKNFTEDLSASLASTFGVGAHHIVELTYRLTPRISLLAGWESESENQKSAFSATARFRFAFRDTPGFSLLHGRQPREPHAH